MSDDNILANAFNRSVNALGDTWLGRLAYMPQYWLRLGNFRRKGKLKRLLGSELELSEVAQPVPWEWILGLFREFAQELKQLRDIRALRQYLGPGAYDDFEGVVLYMIIRRTRPSLLLECSPGYGYSTLYMLAALKANGYGRLLSFEQSPTRIEKALAAASAAGYGSLVKFIAGDARVEIPQTFKSDELASLDFAFIDSDHSYEFAMWYVERILRNLRDDAIIHIHDIQAFESGEGQALLDFMRKEKGKHRYLWCYELFNRPSFLRTARKYWKAPLRYTYDGDSPAFYLLPSELPNS
jgi:predicted O-methyltransferase YrrM